MITKAMFDDDAKMLISFQNPEEQMQVNIGKYKLFPLLGRVDTDGAYAEDMAKLLILEPAEAAPADKNEGVHDDGDDDDDDDDDDDEDEDNLQQKQQQKEEQKEEQQEGEPHESQKDIYSKAAGIEVVDDEDEEEEEEQVNDECNAVEEGKEEGEEVVGSSSEVAVKDKSRPRKEVAAPSRATKPRSVSGNGKVHKTRRVQQPIAPWGDGRMLGAAGGPTMANLVGLLPTSVGQMLRRKVDFLEIDDEIPISAVSSDWSWTFVRSSDGVMCSRAALFFDPNNRHGSRTWGRSAHGAIVVAIRGRVSFDKMARRAEAAGAVALVVVNNHSKWDESFEMGAESVGFAGLYLAAPRVPAILVPKSAKDLLCVSSQERQLRGKIVRR